MLDTFENWLVEFTGTSSVWWIDIFIIVFNVAAIIEPHGAEIAFPTSTLHIAGETPEAFLANSPAES